jgi:hypothetical protein
LKLLAKKQFGQIGFGFPWGESRVLSNVVLIGLVIIGLSDQ